MRNWVAVWALVVTLTGCGSSASNAPSGSAVAALDRQFQDLSLGQVQRAYAEIVPEERALFTAAEYVCEMTEAGPISALDVTVVTQYRERITISGNEDQG